MVLCSSGGGRCVVALSTTATFLSKAKGLFVRLV